VAYNRLQAMSVLLRVPDPAVIPDLLWGLGDVQAEVRLGAENGLRRRPASDVLPVIHLWLRDALALNRVRALRAAAALKDEQLAPAIFEVLDQEADPAVRMEALATLVLLGPGVLPALMRHPGSAGVLSELPTRERTTLLDGWGDARAVDRVSISVRKFASCWQGWGRRPILRVPPS
jgi:hypothetical protein